MPASQAESDSKQTVDLLVHAGWIATVNADNTVHENASLAVQDGRIVDICSRQDATRRFTAAEEYDFPGQMLCPGFVNAHGHAAMSLLRGFADDLPLQTWLQEHIWPAESQFVDAEFVSDGVQLAIAEMLRGGTTCFSDMYFFPNVTALLANKIGIRTQVVFPVMELETAWASSRAECVEKGLQIMDEYKHSAFASVGFGPHAPYSVSRAGLEQVAMLADELDAVVHIHAHETAGEVNDFVAEHGIRPLALLHDIGLTSPRLQCAHMVHANEDDIQMLADTGTHVAHCVRSNLKLASGFCPVEEMQQAGVNVALGTDGAASNNSLDMLAELNLHAILGKAVASKANAVTAVQALRNATINGAKAMGNDDSIGSLEVGKQADFFAIDIDRTECWPMYEPVSHLAYSASSQHITQVWIAGRQQLKDGILTGIDTAELRNKANHWKQKIL